MPKVSFILPAYNPPTLKLRRTGRRFLHEAIASILAQTYRDFELVVVDDCSPEDLKSVVDEFHDERLTYHRNAENLGGKDLVAAWNHAMEYARGEWCVLASDDDVYLPRCLEELMNLQAKYPQCDLFHARNVVIDDNGVWIDLPFERPEFESQIVFSRVRIWNRDQRAPDFMFRISSWRNLHGFVKFPLAWHTDDATWMALAKNGCAHTHSIVFEFRSSGFNLSSHCDGTASDKIEADRQFSLWYEKFVNHLVPCTDEERYIVSRMVADANAQIQWLEDLTLDSVVDFRKWFAALRMYPHSMSFKRARVYKRYPKIAALRRMLSLK